MKMGRNGGHGLRQPAIDAALRAGVLLLGLTTFTKSLRAEETPNPNVASFIGMKFEELLNIRISSIEPKPIESQPAIVTVITASTIEKSGAKDLKDILQLVPGFTAGWDVLGIVGPGFRGIWAYEGKIQVLVDGIEMNEGLFGNVFTLDKFAAANIKRVEILRGPGSAIYGGTAEMAVISIITKGAELNGGFVSERLLLHRTVFSHQVTSSFGYQLTSDWTASGNIAYSEMAPSDQTYLSPDGTVQRNLRDNQAHRPLELNLSIGYKDAEVRVIYNRYLVQDQTSYQVAPQPVPQGLPGTVENNILALSAKDTLRLTSRLSTTPMAIFKYEEPWWLTYNSVQSVNHRRYYRFDLDLPAKIEISDSSRAVLGLHYYHEYARAVAVASYFLPGTTASNYYSGGNHATRDDLAVYAQYDLDSRWANLTLGGRYEWNSYSGSTIVPRVGIVKSWDQFHVKTLYNGSFRTPNIQVANDSPLRLKNESTTTYEVEAGYRAPAGTPGLATWLKGSFSVTGNLYYVRIQNLIGYDATVAGYANGGLMSTEGVELQGRYDSARFGVYLGYSYNRAVAQNFALYTASPTLGHLNLNMPAHQIVWTADWHITDALNWDISGTYLDRRAAFAFPNPNTPSILGRQVLLHTYLKYQWRQFDFGLGVRDLLNQKELLGEPYNGGGAPYRLSGTTLFAQLGVRFNGAR